VGRVLSAPEITGAHSSLHGRDPGGGEDNVIALCSSCKEPFERLDLIAGLCSTCPGNGAPIPLGESDKLTERNLTRGRVKRDATPGDTMKHIETPPRAVERECMRARRSPARTGAGW
jgi:hypothetical protein